MNRLPDISTNFSDWYNEVVYKADLADQGPVRGSIIILPYGYALWENIQKQLDLRIKKTGHKNVALPLLIPESFITKEATHVEGFAPEMAVVTHAGGKKLDEALVIRPTSETIVHYMFAKWIKSYRDLPLKINQWANIVRWEMRTRPFLRTTEIFWQEGHTAHETFEEAYSEVKLMMNEYVQFVQDWLAIPVIQGRKSDQEKFPGAEITLTFEALMQDGKALQMGTSHLLSQSFAKSFDMKYQNAQGEVCYPYLTSWGVTTRLIGAMVMVHGDAKGIVMPPKVAPVQVIIIPIYKSDEDEKIVMNAVRKIIENCNEKNIRIEVDTDKKSPGKKFYKWELRGVPIRIELGVRDLAEQKVIMVDRLSGKKESISQDFIVNKIEEKLIWLQGELFNRAKNILQEKTHKAKFLKQFGPLIEKNGGMYQVGWCKNSACEDQLKKYKAFTRCLLEEKTALHCFYCDKESMVDVIVAKAY